MDLCKLKTTNIVLYHLDYFLFFLFERKIEKANHTRRLQFMKNSVRFWQNIKLAFQWTIIFLLILSWFQLFLNDKKLMQWFLSKKIKKIEFEDLIINLKKSMPCKRQHVIVIFNATNSLFHHFNFAHLLMMSNT